MKLLQLLLSLAAVLTVLLPTDLFPDLIPVIGWLDDLVAAGYLVYELYTLLTKRRRNHSL